MKKLLLLTLLIPSLSFGQKFEVSEMGGSAKDLGTTFFDKNSGYSNQLSVNYYLTKHVSLGAYYEANGWNPATNAGGLLADVHLKHFYFGVSAGEVFFSSKKIEEYFMYNNGTYWAPFEPYFTNVKINPSIALGAHMGMTQKLCKHFSMKEQVGYSYARSSGDYGAHNFSVKVKCASAVAGIAYHF